MKSSCKIITFLISTQLALGPNLSAALANERTPNKESITSPAEFLKQVQLEGESIFGPNGCAKLDDKGNVSYVSQTTKEAIENDEDSPSSVDCAARIAAYAPRYKKAQEVIKEFEKNQKAEDKIQNANCPNCDQSGQSLTGPVDPEHQCSDTEKASIQKQRDSNPQCSMTCELKGSLKKTLDQASFGILGGLVKSSNSCNTEKAGTSPFGCLADFITSLFSSLSSMCKAVWDGMVSAAKGVKNWVAGWFSSNKKVEEAATNAHPAFANMSDEEIKAAQKNPEKANQGLLQKIGKGLNFILENVVGLDTPVYSELWQCAKCGERLGAICKIAGVVGKDVIKNALLVWLGGKAIQGITKMASGALKVASSVGTKMLNMVNKTVLGRTAIKWGANLVAKISERSISGFRAFMATRIGKFSAIAANSSKKVLMKTISVSSTVAGTVFQTIDKVMMMPVKITVRAGRSVASQVRSIMGRSTLYSRTPILAAEEAAETGLRSIKDLPSNTLLQLEVPSPITPAMEKSKSFLSSKMKGKELKAFVEDIENATETTLQVSGSKAIEIETPMGSKFIKIENPESISKVHVFGDDASKAILRTQDGKVMLSQNGKIVKSFSNPEDLKKLDAILGKDIAAADQMALQEMKNTAELNGIKAQEPVASIEPKATDDFKVTTPKECGDIPISFSAMAR